MQAEYSVLGESAIRIEFGSSIDWQLNQKVHRVRQCLLASAVKGLVEVIPGYSTLVVRFDPLIIKRDALESRIHNCIEELGDSYLYDHREIEIPVIYGGKYGPDLDYVARVHGLTSCEVVEIHCGCVYRVFMVGFSPGFAYLGTLPESIATPRRETPRTAVPAGSVGIAGNQTGIYPMESPGGWQLIGQTNLKMFDPCQENPCLLNPGDVVRFLPVSVVNT